MKLKAYAIFDIKADVFNVPFFFTTNGQAVRAFQDLAQDPQSTVSKHPEDYKLVRLGSYDDETGVLEPCTQESLGFAFEYVRQRGTVIGAATEQAAKELMGKAGA